MCTVCAGDVRVCGCTPYSSVTLRDSVRPGILAVVLSGRSHTVALVLFVCGIGFTQCNTVNGVLLRVAFSAFSVNPLSDVSCRDYEREALRQCAGFLEPERLWASFAAHAPSLPHFRAPSSYLKHIPHPFQAAMSSPVEPFILSKQSLLRAVLRASCMPAWPVRRSPPTVGCSTRPSLPHRVSRERTTTR